MTSVFSMSRSVSIISFMCIAASFMTHASVTGRPAFLLKRQ